MNKGCIVAILDDLQMSVHLAKISTTYAYELNFCDKISQISYKSSPTAIIIDLNSTSEEDLQKIVASTQNHNITIMGYCQELNSPLLNYFKEMGCEVVFKRYELMKNLGQILSNLFNAS